MIVWDDMILLERMSKPMCFSLLVWYVLRHQTFNFQLDREAWRADTNAFALEGKHSGSIMTPSYSSSHASRNSGVSIAAVMSGDRALIPFFLIRRPPQRDVMEEEFDIALPDIKPLNEKSEEHNE